MRHRLASLALATALCAQVAHAQGVSDQAARHALDALPFLNPEMLRELANKMTGARTGMDEATNPPPVIPRQRPLYISTVSPGPVPEVDMVYGYPTTITFIDKTGRPWPVHWELKTNEYSDPPKPQSGTGNGNQQVSVYEQEAVNVSPISVGHGFEYDVPSKGKDGNIITINAKSPGPRAGMTVKLAGLPTPIPFLLRAVGSQGGYFDSNVTVIIESRGPEAAPILSVAQEDAVPVTGTAVMDDILNNHPPAAAEPIDVIGFDPNRIRAWRMGKYFYLRTDADVLSPQPRSSASGAGANIFEIPAAADVVLLSDHGRTTSIQLKQRD